MAQVETIDSKEQPEGQSMNSNRRCRCLFCCWQPPFSLFEEKDERVVVDIPRTFAPTFGGGRLAWGVSLLKVILFALSAAYVIWASTNLTDYAEEPRNANFLIYLTNWGAILTALYLLFSAACHLARDTSLLHQPEDPYNDKPSWLVRTTWFLGALVYPMQVTIVILFWALVYHGQELTPLNLGGHGGEFILIFVDVVLVNNIPIRWSHFLFLEASGVITLSWTVIYAFADMDDGVIYDILDWGNKPATAGIYAVALVFVFVPICFAVAWVSSLLPQWLARYCCRSSTSSRRRVVAFTIESGDVERDI